MMKISEEESTLLPEYWRIDLATSTLIRCRNPRMSALAYKMSTILFHNGVSYQDSVTIPVLLEHLVILVGYML